MRVDTTREGNVITLRPNGLLAGADVDGFQAHLAKAMEEGQVEIVVDTSGILFADSRALETLAVAAERLIQNGRTLRLAGPNPNLEEVLELTELAPLFRFYADALSAVESCR